jgi:glycerophosphoryl diester phosphodiesterase
MMRSNRTQIIAHRGASADAPENTLEAFQLGLDQRADAIECDIHLSQDGELVVIHDATVEHITGEKRTVASLTLAELQALDAGSWKAPQWKDARIPTLAETLDLVPADRRIFIEVKVGRAALPQLKTVLDACRLARSQIVLMEFDLETVIAMRAAFPNIETLWLNDFPALGFPWRRRRTIAKNLRLARQQGFDGVNLQDIRQLNADVLHACHALGLKSYCWTVDDPARAVVLMKGGINGIATNRPGWMREQLHLEQGVPHP